jgi:WD40 repeat protein/tRNA A-37 threonylcarbamoyl transferase component Bud32
MKPSAEFAGGHEEAPAPKSAVELFGNALELPPEDRAAYLERACGGDGPLRNEVESLLDAHPSDAGFLGQSPRVDSPGVLAELLGGAAAGARVGPYRLLGLIATGGMGAVYSAERIDEAFQKQVAIKLIRPDLWDEVTIRRFRLERQVLADMEHPGIARLIDGGSTDAGLPYLVMEYVDGVPVTTYCDTHALDVTARLDLFLQVCDAVQYAHRNLVIHRDLKPTNILVDRSGRPKLLDFGIAVAVESGSIPESAGTTTRNVRWTPRYASPEQALGRRATTATDIYSLGVVLYELLTGRFPYELDANSPIEMVRTIAETDAMRPSARVASPRSRRLAGDLDTIVLKALHKDPARRYVSVEELAADIRRHLTGLPVLARPDSMAYRVSKFVARHKVLVGGVCVTMLVLTAALALTTRAYRIASARQQEAEWQAYVASLAAAESSLLASQVAEAALRLDAAPTHLRAWEWHHLHGRLDRSTTRFEAHRSGITSLAFPADGGGLITASLDSTVSIWRDRSGTRERSYRLDAGVESIDPVPNGSLLAVGLSDGRVQLLDLVHGSTRDLLPGGSSWAVVSASPDGSRVAGGFFDGTVRIWSLPAGSVVEDWKAHSGLAHVAYSPDGETLATAGADGKLSLHDARTSRKVRTLDAHPQRIYSLAFSPDGSALATGSIDQTVSVWDVRAQTLIRTFREHRGTVAAITFTPGGDRIASAAADNRLLLWSVSTGAVLGELRGHALDVYALAASPDGSALISGDWGGVAKSWAWDVQDVRTLQLTNPWIVPQVYEAAWSLDERLLALGTNAGFLPLWSTTWESLGSLSADEPTFCLAFSPDGTVLASGGESGTIHLYRVADHAVLRAVEAHRGRVLALAVRSGGQMLVTASADSTLKLWSLPDLDLIRVLEEHEGEVQDVEFSPLDDTFASCGDDGMVRLWDARSGNPAGALRTEDADLTDLAFAPTGRYLVTGSAEGAVRVWDVANGRPRACLRERGPKVSAVAWSRDGTRIAVGGSDAIVRVYDAVSEREVVSLHGHIARITSLRFGGDDTRLVSTSADGSARIWDSVH